MNVFMTGGAGYIGSVTAEILLTSGHQVTIYDNLSRGHLAAIPSGARYVNGDIGDRKLYGMRLHLRILTSSFISLH